MANVQTSFQAMQKPVNDDWQAGKLHKHDEVAK
jgi:hypothetical protein